jgi:Ca2+-transporting ATPase
MPASAEGFSFTWLGLIGLADPLRDEVPQAMEQCRQAGIRVIMVTGDYPLTARVIANRIWQWHFGQGIVRTVSDFGTRS